MKLNECGGIFNTGKCVLTKQECKEFRLNLTTERRICTQGNEYGECDLVLRETGLRKKT